MTQKLDRRKFIHASSAAIGLALVSDGQRNAVGAVDGSSLTQDKPSEPRRKIKKSVKWGMVGAGDSVLKKFEIQKSLGYDGVEFISPSNTNLDEVVQAAKQTEMPVHGLVNMKHWKVRMSSPDEQQRESAVDIMKRCIDDVHKLGGDSVLLVPGQVNGEDESHQLVWKRSIAAIRQVIPTAEKRKVKILIENVWNRFCEQPEELRDYIDEINSEWVKVYFDIGNARKFAPSEKWIEVLGKRIVKLDVKDWGKKNGFCKIGDGDVDWPAVCKALDKLEFDGWCTAEVTGGDESRLKDIADRMDRVLVP